MTMPDERPRDLKWGFAQLHELVAESDAPSDLRERAARLADHYPTPAALDQLISDNAQTMPRALAGAIEDAGALLRDVQASCGGNVDTRKSVLYTLRHFLTPGVARAWAACGFGGCIGRWLALGQW